jgi:hypothetical protein
MEYAGQGNKTKNVWGIAPRLVEDFYMLPEAEAGLASMMGGGGGGFSMRAKPVNQLDRMIAYSQGKPGEFKMATDQYAARYSDQLDEMALEELKQKYPEGPASGGSWDDFDKQRKSNIANYYDTGKLWGPESQKLIMNAPSFVPTGGPLSSMLDGKDGGVFGGGNSGGGNSGGGTIFPGVAPVTSYTDIPSFTDSAGTMYGGRYGL